MVKLGFYRKKRQTPATLITAPMTSRRRTRWWKRSAAGAMMSTGVRAKRVWAMPVEVYCVARREALTPMKGPKTVAPKTHHIALRSWMAWLSFATACLSKRKWSRANPASPIKARIIVAAKGTVRNRGRGRRAPSAGRLGSTPSEASEAS